MRLKELLDEVINKVWNDLKKRFKEEKCLESEEFIENVV